MPWVHNARDNQRRNGNPYWKTYLDCADCYRRNPVAIRAGWNCGFLPERLRTGPGFPAPEEWGYRVEPIDDESPHDYMRRQSALICPGYLVTLPEVFEAALMHRWFAAGVLEARLDGEPVTPRAVEAIDILAGSISEVEAHSVAPAKRSRNG